MTEASLHIELENPEDEDADRSYAVEIKITSWGAPAHYGSMSYPGHPADPIEFEIWDVAFVYDDVEYPMFYSPELEQELYSYICENVSLEEYAPEPYDDY